MVPGERKLLKRGFNLVRCLLVAVIVECGQGPDNLVRDC